MFKNKLQKIIEYGLYLFLFIFPWQTRWIIKDGKINGGYFEYGTYSLYISDILLLLLLFLWLFYFFNKNLTIKKLEKFWIALAFLDAIIFISVFIASNHFLAFYKYIYFLLGVGLFALIVYFPFNKTKAIFSFSLALLFQSLIAVAQFLTQLSPANKWLGMAEHDPAQLGISVVEGMGNLGFVERWLRAYGAFDHPNILGGFLALGLFVLIANLIARSKTIDLDKSDNFREKIFRMNIFFYPVILIIIVGIFFSFSRSAWLAVSIFLLLFLIISVINKDKLAQKYFLPIFLYIGIIIFIISLPFSNLIDARFKGQGRLEHISKEERIQSVYLAKDVLSDNWLFGVGVGNYTLSLRDKYFKDQEAYYYQPTHNTFLLIWSEIGIFGFMAFLFFLFFIFFQKITKKHMLYRIPIFVSLAVLMFFDHWWWSLHFGVLYFWLICGFSLLFFKRFA